METTQNIKSSFYTVPEDLICDILRILINNDVSYSIKGVTENQNSIVVEIKIQPDHQFAKEIKENIDMTLNDYQFYLNERQFVDNH